MRNGRLWLVGVIALFVGFWLLRGVLSSPDGSPSESGEPARRSVLAAEEVEAQELVVELVEPPSSAGTISPTGLLRRMYSSLWMANGFCWEEAEAAYDAASPKVDTGLDPGGDPPADLLEFFEGRGESYDDYAYHWFNRNQLLFMHQEMVVTEGGRSGPSAGVLRIVRREGPDSQQFWETYDAAAVYPCD
ncbi:MAG: hypothetical protein OXN86_12160 [Chloroflexota bacterium]|nr:hypothetical protein [Chloroflexota bacterium]